MIELLKDLGTVACARRAHLNDLEVNNPEADWLELTADRSKNPTLQDWHRLFQKIRKDLFGDRNGDFMMEKLKEFEQQRPDDVKLTTFPNSKTGLEEFAFIMRTPFMKRVTECIPETRDICFVDSSASCDLDDVSLTFIVSSTSAGAIPLAVAIHSSQTTNCYT